MKARDANRMLGRLRKALCELERDQGRVARRNARVGIAGAIRSLKMQMDRDWPLPAKAPPPSSFTLEAKAERLTLRGMQQEVLDLLPPRWDQTEAQLFLAAALEGTGRHPRPIILTSGLRGSGPLISETEIMIDRHRITTDPKRHEQYLWLRLIKATMNLSITSMVKERGLVREMVRLYRILERRPWAEEE